MKNIVPNFEEFLNEVLDIKALMAKHGKNPYGIGANIVDLESSEFAVLRFEDSYSRDETKQKLRKEGIPAKKFKNSMQGQAFAQRYELIVFY